MKNRIEIKTRRLQRRRKGLRKRAMGAPDRPRLAVCRSLRHIYAQVIDDLSGRTLAAASTRDKDSPEARGGNCSAAAEVGKRLAERAQQAGINQVVFDRGGRKYHGRVKALADAAREAGLKF
ncbi:MAG: 50S ribosomal protein L18 [Planctomycetota bacterium]|jgi:large subunit ribosomal protein L18